MYDFWDYLPGLIISLPFVFVLGFFIWTKIYFIWILLNALLGNGPVIASDDDYLSIKTRAYDYDEDGY